MEIKWLKCKFKYKVLLKLVFGLVISVLYFGLLLRESIHAIKVGNQLRTTAKLENKKIVKPPTIQPIVIPIIVKTVKRDPPPPTINEYEYSEEDNTAAERDFLERKRLLMDECANLNLLNVYPPNAWEFFNSPGHNLVWCNVFKAASSTWLYLFNVLAGYDVKYLQKTKTSPLELARKRFPRPTFEELYDSLATSISFLFVREPFERLISGYRNKLEGARNNYYKLLASKIVKKFRIHSNSTAKAKSGPTFKEFLQYLIHSHKTNTNSKFDEHWAPIYTFCTPCSINFTLIAKMETFQRDTDYIIRQAGLENILLNKLPKRNINSIFNRAVSPTKTLKARYFSEIDSELLVELLQIYEPDFQLFGYNSTPYFELVQSTTR